MAGTTTAPVTAAAAVAAAVGVGAKVVMGATAVAVLRVAGHGLLPGRQAAVAVEHNSTLPCWRCGVVVVGAAAGGSCVKACGHARLGTAAATVRPPLSRRRGWWVVQRQAPPAELVQVMITDAARALRAAAASVEVVVAAVAVEVLGSAAAMVVAVASLASGLEQHMTGRCGHGWQSHRVAAARLCTCR